ncbi:MAG TPA: methionyl-tRNA formyltransferase [Candidatus Paceibacterota bacterium]|nr:methionyl-tRNA formyltransferase [Candidatus Paceibacterota bacterium]
MKKQPIKIIFWGTPYFSAKILEALINADFSPILTITALDKPKGRGLEKQASEAKRMAIKHGLNVAQPQKLKEISFLEQIRVLKPDLFVVASYGKIIPKEILEIPKLGCLNVHPSLLPCHRGASPIQATILSGEKETGVTIMLMDEEMDHGPILANSQFQIQNLKITFKELEEILIAESSRLLIETLPKWINGEIKPKPQDNNRATFCKIIKKEDAKINFNESAAVIERKIRAFNPWPGTYFEINAKKFKILEADVLADATPIAKKTGDIFCFNKKLAIQCREGVLIVEKIQPESKGPIGGYAFWCGYQNKLK